MLLCGFRQVGGGGVVGGRSEWRGWVGGWGEMGFLRWGWDGL